MALRFASSAAVAFPAPVSILENGPTRPRLGAKAELRTAFDRSEDFLTRFVEAAERSEGVCEVVPYSALVCGILHLAILVRCQAIKCRSLLKAAGNLDIEIPQLIQRSRLPSDISEAHCDL
jgi:hypothetical protein